MSAPCPVCVREFATTAAGPYFYGMGCALAAGGLPEAVVHREVGRGKAVNYLGELRRYYLPAAGRQATE